MLDVMSCGAAGVCVRKGEEKRPRGRWMLPKPFSHIIYTHCTIPMMGGSKGTAWALSLILLIGASVAEKRGLRASPLAERAFTGDDDGRSGPIYGGPRYGVLCKYPMRRIDSDLL